MLRLATLSLLLTAPVLAQTTWTSFEDRKGHAIASDPAGGVLMFGGESSTSAGEYLDDTNTFANPGATASWTQINPFSRPTARTEHAMASGVSTDDAAIFILFGGLAVPTTGGAPIPNGETFIYDGSGWGNGVLHAAGPSARTGHTMVNDTRRNRVVLFGGFSGGFAVNDLWEFDPVNDIWLQPTITGSTPLSRFDHATAFHPGNGASDGRIYVFGGTPFRDDMWEYDPFSSTWTDVTPATRPSGRRRTAMAFLPAYDNIVLFGGQNSLQQALADTWVWDRTGGTWTQATPTTTAPGRWDHAMAPDQLGNNVVLLGGDDGGGTALEGTWLWTGIDWSEQLPPPSPRTGVAMAYDGNRDRHPTFGGRAIPSGIDLDETWELDGLNWRQRSPSTKPSARADAGIAYDSNRQRTVLFGGRAGGPCGTELGDTWEWNGQNWSPRVLPNNPPVAGGVQPVFDSLRNVTWMLVGSQMWSYDGTDWTEFARPEGRYASAHCYDAARNRLVVFGGSRGPSSHYTDELWEWDGSWHRVDANPTWPAARNYSAMVFDPTQQVSMMFGGILSSPPLAFANDTRTWDGAAWATGAGSSPSARYGQGQAFDAGRNRVVLFGGANTQHLNDTWEWNGSNWTLQPTTTLPGRRNNPGMVYDQVRQKIVMFGGQKSSSYTNETWEFDGTDWVQLSLSPPAALLPRHVGQLAFDPVSQKVLLFGGATMWANNVALGDTWLWDGTSWTQQFPTITPPLRWAGVAASDGSRVLMGFGADTNAANRYTDLWQWNGVDWAQLDAGLPSSRTNYGAAYDVRRDRVVVFGGRNSCGSGNYLDETWEWNGGSWQQRFPANSPSPRERSKLTYDESRGRVVLFGGTDSTNTLNDTWEWDGNDWISRAPVSSPPGSSGHGLSYDQQRRVTVAFSELGTWDYGSTHPANIEPFGIGCPGSNGTPSLSPKPWAGPWLGGQLKVDLVNQPPGLGLFVWGYSETAWIGGPLPFSLVPLGAGPGCELLVSDTIVQLFLSGTNPYVSFVLPNHPSFLGKVMRAQAGFLDTGMGGAPVVTHALRMTFGSK